MRGLMLAFLAMNEAGLPTGAGARRFTKTLAKNTTATTV
jgi:hypothetical protein